MERKVIFKDTETGEELMLPVTPPELAADVMQNVEITNISALGDVAIPGKPSLGQMSLECLFPKQRYSFCCCEPLEPYAYVDKFSAWAKAGRVLRCIWSDTEFNVPVLVSGIRFLENDGTNDVRATIDLREYRYITAKLIPLTPEDTGREEEPATDAESSYTVVWGDTLGAISKKFYGDANVYPLLASYNSIANPHLIHPGQVLKIPPIAVLRGTSKAPAYSGAKYVPKAPPTPKLPKTVQKRYSDKVLAMKEKQMSR